MSCLEGWEAHHLINMGGDGLAVKSLAFHSDSRGSVPRTGVEFSEMNYHLDQPIIIMYWFVWCRYNVTSWGIVLGTFGMVFGEVAL